MAKRLLKAKEKWEFFQIEFDASHVSDVFNWKSKGYNYCITFFFFVKFCGQVHVVALT